MKLTVLDTGNLTFNDMVKKQDELYYIAMNDSKMEIVSVKEKGFMGNGEDFLLVHITDTEDISDIPEDVSASKETDTKLGRRTELTYKFFGTDPTKSIFVDFRPEHSGIRVSFKDKEIAEIYFDHFREQFYTSKTGASVITVSNIYKELNLVNWGEIKDECDDWGWYTLDHGTCRYISQVNRNRDDKGKWGFTLKRPTKLYESRKKEA